MPPYKSMYTQCLPTKVHTYNVSLQKYVHAIHTYIQCLPTKVCTHNVSPQKYVHTMSPYKSMCTQCLPTKVCTHNASPQKNVHTMSPYKSTYTQSLPTKVWTTNIYRYVHWAVRHHKLSVSVCIPTFYHSITTCDHGILSVEAVDNIQWAFVTLVQAYNARRMSDLHNSILSIEAVDSIQTNHCHTNQITHKQQSCMLHSISVRNNGQHSDIFRPF